MCDLVPFWTLEMINGCVSWTTRSSCWLPPLGVSLPPFISCLTTIRMRYFLSASSLVSQLSNIIFPILCFFFCPRPTPFPALHYLFRKWWPLIGPRRPRWLAVALWHTLISCNPHLQDTGGTRSLSTGPEPCSALHKQGKASILSPWQCAQKDTCTIMQYHTVLGITFRTLIALQKEEVFIVSKAI